MKKIWPDRLNTVVKKVQLTEDKKFYRLQRETLIKLPENKVLIIKKRQSKKRDKSYRKDHVKMKGFLRVTYMLFH